MMFKISPPAIRLHKVKLEPTSGAGSVISSIEIGLTAKTEFFLGHLFS